MGSESAQERKHRLEIQNMTSLSLGFIDKWINRKIF